MMKQTQSRMTEMSGTGRNHASRKLAGSDAGASSITARREHSTEEGMMFLEQVVARENMTRAYAQVVRNKGAAGIDEMTVDELKPHLQAQWECLKADPDGTLTATAAAILEQSNHLSRQIK